MSDPKTLLQMAGADSSPSALSDSAVVIIDAQMEYLDGKLPLTGIEPALGEIARLLARARAAGSPILHIAHQGQPGGLFDPAGPGCEIAPAAAPAGDERVISKTKPNAFAGTTLSDVLSETGRKELVVAGFMTHMCLSSSVRAALEEGYRATVVAGAVATRDLPKPGGGVIKATELN